MAGIRIKHSSPEVRNVRFNVVESDHPYPSGPYTCTPPEFGGCGGTHIFKTHHLNIDETGSCIIGDVLFEKIKAHILDAGFTVMNVVDKPPALSIGLGPQIEGRGAWGNIPIIRSE